MEAGNPRHETSSASRGVWPVRLTAFLENGNIDWHGVEALVEWYIGAGVAGLFTVCLSSEMYHLSPAERVDLAVRVVAQANGRVPVVAGGAFGDSLVEQTEMVRRLADTGVTAVVLTANQLASEDEPDTVWQRRATAMLDACEGIPFGLYECPRPYHRKLGPALLRWAAETGRFVFLKDTCCRRDLIDEKLQAVRGTSLSWFNAHCPTLLYSLRSGGRGYNGIAANFYPELFVRLCARFAAHPAEAERLQRFLTLADPTIRNRYPASAKRYLGLLGLPIGPTCRVPVAPPRPDDDEELVLTNLREAVREIEESL
jgi:4-hydroxy-tetrahydrodipicolinate synthase